jgi:hypothetical protein
LFDPRDGQWVRAVTRVALNRAYLAEQPHAKAGRARTRGTTPCKGGARRAAQSLRNNPMQRRAVRKAAEQPHAKGARGGCAEIRGTTPCKGAGRGPWENSEINPMQSPAAAAFARP